MSENLATHIDTEPMQGPVSVDASHLERQAAAWARQFFQAAAALCPEQLELQPPFAIASDGLHVLMATLWKSNGDSTITMHEIRASEGVDADGCITFECGAILRWFPRELSHRIPPLRDQRRKFVATALAEVLAELAAESGRPYSEMGEIRISVHCEIGGAW